MLGTGLAKHSLYDLVVKARSHEYQVPEFQRDLVWGPEQVRELLVSLVQGHFAGVLLMLGFNPMTPPFAHREIYGAPSLPSTPTTTSAYSVLDGQQRISAVYYAFQHPSLPLPTSSKKKRFYYFLRLDELEAENFDDAVVAEPEGSSALKSIILDWTRGLAIPFGPIDPSLVPSGASPLITLWGLLSSGGWMSASSLLSGYLTGTGSRYAGSIGRILPALLPLLNYHFDVVVLSLSGSASSPTDPVNVIATLFVNVNSKGTRLTLFDLAVAHLFPLLHPTGLNLRVLWSGLPTSHPGLALPIDRGTIDPDDFLRLLALITGGSVKKASLLGHLHGVASHLTTGTPVSSPAGHVFTSFPDLWEEAASCLEEAYNRVIKDYGALRPEWIPYPSMLTPLAALIHMERRSGVPGARGKIDCWYWHSVFYERYAKSVDTTTMADFNAVKGWILGSSGKPPWITGAVPPGLDLKLENNPKSPLFKGTLNLIALAGAMDMLTGRPRGIDLELDHLFPKNGKMPWSGHAWINSVLNFTLLDSSVNRNKGTKDPHTFYHSDVLPGHKGASVSATFQSHLIGSAAEGAFSKASSTSPSAVSDFEKFIDEREKDVLTAILHRLSPCV